jgi:hypothetical protein
MSFNISDCLTTKLFFYLTYQSTNMRSANGEANIGTRAGVLAATQCVSQLKFVEFQEPR